MNSTLSPQPFTRTDANEVLDLPGVRAAHLVDAVLVGVATYNEALAAIGETALRPLFSQVDANRVQFALFAGESCVHLCAYTYEPDEMPGPMLERTDPSGQPLGRSDLTNALHPLMDMALARMEGQVWGRVTA